MRPFMIDFHLDCFFRHCSHCMLFAFASIADSRRAYATDAANIFLRRFRH